MSDFLVQVSSISEIISRDQMKVAFFGRTSNGKSTTVNAMLQDKILPTGMGHTTNCFLSVHGSDLPDPYILLPGSDDKKNVKVCLKNYCKFLLCNNYLYHIFLIKQPVHLFQTLPGEPGAISIRMLF